MTPVWTGAGVLHEMKGCSDVAPFRFTYQTMNVRTPESETVGIENQG